MSGAEERATHPEGKPFMDWFEGQLFNLQANPWCFHRDVLRDCKEELWAAWKKRAGY